MGRPRAAKRSTTFRYSSHDCRCDGLSRSTGEHGRSNAVFKAKAAATDDLPACRLANSKIRSDDERSNDSCQVSGCKFALVSIRKGFSVRDAKNPGLRSCRRRANASRRFSLLTIVRKLMASPQSFFFCNPSMQLSVCRLILRRLKAIVRDSRYERALLTNQGVLISG